MLALWVLATLGICPPAHAGVTAVAEPANATLERGYAYDAAGQLIARADSLRGRQDFRYDPTGRILASLVLGRDDPWSRSGLVGLARRTALPPEPIRYLGARVVRHAIRRQPSTGGHFRRCGPGCPGRRKIPSSRY